MGQEPQGGKVSDQCTKARFCLRYANNIHGPIRKTPKGKYQTINETKNTNIMGQEPQGEKV